MKYTPTGSWGVRVRRGFDVSVENYLNTHDNAEDDPYIQVFDNEEDVDDYKAYFCAICKKEIKYHPNLQEWFCDNCGQHYDTKIQDRPITNKTGFRVTPHFDIARYPKADEEDPDVPYAQAIQLDEDNIGYTEEVELVKSSPDQRIKHIRVKGNMVDALSADI